MAYRVSSRHLLVPQNHWDTLSGSQFKPLAMYFATGRGGGLSKPYYTMDFRLDGNSAATLAKALAFFFVMDDYGSNVWLKLEKNVAVMHKALEKMKQLCWGSEYREWKEEEQRRFIEFCKEIERHEQEVVG